MILTSIFWCKSNPFNDDHVDVDEKQPFLYYDANDTETGKYHLSFHSINTNSIRPLTKFN